MSLVKFFHNAYTICSVGTSGHVPVQGAWISGDRICEVPPLLLLHSHPRNFSCHIQSVCVWWWQRGSRETEISTTILFTELHSSSSVVAFLHKTYNGSHPHPLIWPGHWVSPTDNILTDLEGRGGWREEGRRMGRRKVSLFMSMLSGFLPGRLGAWPPSLSHILCASWRKACGNVYTAWDYFNIFWYTWSNTL